MLMASSPKFEVWLAVELSSKSYLHLPWQQSVLSRAAVNIKPSVVGMASKYILIDIFSISIYLIVGYGRSVKMRKDVITNHRIIREQRIAAYKGYRGGGLTMLLMSLSYETVHIDRDSLAALTRVRIDQFLVKSNHLKRYASISSKMNSEVKDSESGWDLPPEE
ncbi:hypothetical protein Tco_0227806 [Tanacetum coccineum]